MDNANTITDMAKTQNTVYEIVSDMSSRQDALEERIQNMEDKIQTVQVKKKTLHQMMSFLEQCKARILFQLYFLTLGST